MREKLLIPTGAKSGYTLLKQMQALLGLSALRQYPAAIECSDDDVGAKALLGGERVQVRGERSDLVDVSPQLMDRRSTRDSEAER